MRIEHGCSELPGQWWAVQVSAQCAGSSFTHDKEIHHIEHSCESCKTAVQAGLVQATAEAQVSALDAEDAKERRGTETESLLFGSSW